MLGKKLIDKYSKCVICKKPSVYIYGIEKSNGGILHGGFCEDHFEGMERGLEILDQKKGKYIGAFKILLEKK